MFSTDDHHHEQAWLASQVFSLFPIIEVGMMSKYQSDNK